MSIENTNSLTEHFGKNLSKIRKCMKILKLIRKHDDAILNKKSKKI